MALLEIKNLSAGYGDFSVLRGVSMRIEPEEFVALIGPNGAGKTTVFKSVIGLTHKTEGKIFFEDKEITHLPAHALLEEGIGFVPQGRLMFYSLTVRESLEMGGYLVRNKEVLGKNMELVWRYFPILKEKLREKSGNLSGGQQQMLAIGRALMTSPRLLMLDEPSLGLSPKVTQEVFEKLKEINATGTTVVVVEQNVRLVLRYAQRGYLLSLGQIKTTGSARELSDEKLMHAAYLA